MNFSKSASALEEEIVIDMNEPVRMASEKAETPAATQTATQVSQDDLFTAHDFDIKIDLEVPLPSK